MTDIQIQLIQLAWEQVQPQTDEVARTFYGHLFAQAPALQQLFPRHFQYQLNKLGDTLSSIVNDLGRMDRLVPQIQLLGMRHAYYNVQLGHYGLMKNSLMYALATHLGDHWSQGMAEAWETAYQFVADVMIETQVGVQNTILRKAV